MNLKRIAPAALAAFVAVVLFAGCPKQRPPDTPMGAATGMKGVPYTCSTQVTSDDGEDVAYQFDWGDGQQSNWSGFLPSGTFWADSHVYGDNGRVDIRARAKSTNKGAGDWSDPLEVFIDVGEGEVRWSFQTLDPEESEDYLEFSYNTFAIANDASSFIGAEYGVVVGRKPTGAIKWEFVNPEFDDFLAAPTVTNSGLIYIGCTDNLLYAINENGTMAWRYDMRDEIVATAAIGTDGTIFVHTATESLYALTPTPSRKWSRFTGGGLSSPVIGTDGTVYVCNGDGQLFAFDPSDGTPKGQLAISSQEIIASPAIDASRNTIYMVDEDGYFAAVELNDLTKTAWEITGLGSDAQSPVIGGDGTVYVGAGGKLHALSPETQDVRWRFTPALAGDISTPAVTEAGYVYALVTIGKKDVDDPDSLYAVNSDGTYRWACALGEGSSAEIFSAPKLDAEGNIYIGSGLKAWCVGGVSPPAASSWPQFQADARNTGRAGN
jgi:outer membrane protein assembly factor BamB